MKNEVELTKKHFKLNECYDKDTGNSSIPASRRMLWNKIEQLKQERQKVIAELEEWLAAEINKGFHKITEGSYLKLESRFINSRDLQQKLNEMKGETK